MQKEDFLLKQIDEFKEKAKQLHSMLATKENKVQELQGILVEREEKAKQLKSVHCLNLFIYSERQSVNLTLYALYDLICLLLNSNSRQEMAEIDKRIEQFSQDSAKKLDECTEAISSELKEFSAQLDDIEKNVSPLI